MTRAGGTPEISKVIPDGVSGESPMSLPGTHSRSWLYTRGSSEVSSKRTERLRTTLTPPGGLEGGSHFFQRIDGLKPLVLHGDVRRKGL